MAASTAEDGLKAACGYASLGGGIFDVVASTLLLVGKLRERHGLILPWIIFRLTAIVIGSGGVVIVGYVTMNLGLGGAVTLIILGILLQLAFLYQVYVVYQHYNLLLEESILGDPKNKTMTNEAEWVTNDPGRPPVLITDYWAV